MSMSSSFKSSSCFSGSQSQVCWEGKKILDENEFDAYLKQSVYRRLTDADNREPCIAELEALATTGMATNTLEQLLASEPVPQAWEVGEALAECLLEHIRSVKLPWNTERDKRTPKASLPGADIVGFFVEENDVFLVLGEVKTSEDINTPPCVMYGRSGIIHQIDTLATQIEIHFCLIKWLHARCQKTQLWSLYQKAIGQYLESSGRALMLCGLLMRDTLPNELDLKQRATKLASSIVAPTRVELTAWYLPRPIASWPNITSGGTG